MDTRNVALTRVRARNLNCYCSSIGILRARFLFRVRGLEKPRKDRDCVRVMNINRKRITCNA